MMAVVSGGACLAQVNNLDPLLLVHLLPVLILNSLELHFLLLNPGGTGGALNQLFRDFPVGDCLACFYGLKKFGMSLLPGIDGDCTDIEEVS
jgi:hypothetical protein